AGPVSRLPARFLALLALVAFMALTFPEAASSPALVSPSESYLARRRYEHLFYPKPMRNGSACAGKIAAAAQALARSSTSAASLRRQPLHAHPLARPAQRRSALGPATRRRSPRWEEPRRCPPDLTRLQGRRGQSWRRPEPAWRSASSQSSAGRRPRAGSRWPTAAHPIPAPPCSA